ncbi:MAG: PrsW family glutamic-type intramembrane protease [Planctomycetota bacterium]|nr:PrsW family glutamic-type intramembrane protease [Planctomycetota bacterium]
MLLSLAVLYGALAVLSLGIAMLVVRYDLYDREPWFMLVIATAAGAALMWCAGRVQAGLIDWLDDHPVLMSNLFYASLAALTEELAKFSVVLIICFAFRRHFNDPMDGIVYGSFAGLGAAIEESIWVMGWPDQIQFLPAQEPIRLMGHLVMGGIGCAALGFRPLGGRSARFFVPVGLLAAIALHALWDVVAFASHDEFRATQRISAIHSFFGVLLMLAGMIMFRFFVSIASESSRRLFARTATRAEASANGPNHQ